MRQTLVTADEIEEAPVRELRALGMTDDGKSLVLVDLTRGAEGERFRVSADERLRAALRSGAPRAVVAQAETRVESAISPREIQARLRAGAGAEEVAKAAGIPVGRIQRYEAPILAERDRVVSEARRASAPGPHRNTPGRPLGTLVDNRLTEEEIDPESVAWDAKRRPDGTWLVTLARHVGASVRATWSWDPQARRVRAIDAGATAVLAPMPAPSTGPDSLTAVAEAAGVSTESNREAEQQAVAVGEDRALGDDVFRRGSAATRGNPGRSGGLVVVAGRSDEQQRPSVTVPANAEIDLDVPGGAVVPAAPREPVAPRMDASELLLPGAAPVGAHPYVRRPEPEVRPSRQERLPQETTSVATAAPATDSVTTDPATATAPATPSAPATTPAATTTNVRPADVTAPTTSSEPPPAAADDIPASGTPTSSSPTVGARTTKSSTARRRSAVPAWDDIMFGARRS